MKRYSIFHLPIMSFFSKSVYCDVALRWKGTGFAYLLLLLGVFTCISLVSPYFEFCWDWIPKIISQIPTIRIVDGEASIDEPQPYYIRDPQTDKVAVVIDTTGTITSLDDTEALFLVKKTKLIIGETATPRETLSFSQIKDFTLDQEKLTGWLRVFKILFWLVLYPLFVLVRFALTIVKVLIYAVIGMLFSSWCKSKRSYTSLLRIAVVAVTPCIIIKTIIDMARIDIPVAWLLYFLVAMGYLLFGVRAASEGEDPTSRFQATASGRA